MVDWNMIYQFGYFYIFDYPHRIDEQGSYHMVIRVANRNYFMIWSMVDADY
jgi:hypothetical protein